MKRTILAIAIFSFFSVQASGKTDPSVEQAIINGPAVEKGRCWEISAAECRRERQALKNRGCISAWALAELENKIGPEGERGGFPQCDSRSTLKRWCYCGCFHPDTKLLAYDKIKNIQLYVAASELIRGLQRYDLMAVDEHATLSRIDIAALGIEKFTSGPEKDAIVVLNLENGAQLKLSSQHAVLLAEGKMVVAEDLKQGDLLISVRGEPVQIASIQREMITEEVVNFLTVGKSLRSHMLIAEGVVVGDLAWQNDLVPVLDFYVME